MYHIPRAYSRFVCPASLCYGMIRMTFRISPSGLLLFYVGLLLAAWPVQTAYAQNAGRIAVTVTNRTTGEPVAGQEVTLRRHVSEEEQEQIIAQGVTDRSGRYVFASLPVDGAHYAVTARYHDIPYTTGHLVLQTGAASHETGIDVFETTTQDTDILVEAHHLVVDAQPNTFDVTEILVFQNHGNSTYIPAQTGLRLPLPAAAFQLQPMSPGIESSGQGLIYTRPVPPGQSQVIYTYTLDRKQVDNLLTARMEYDTGRIQALITPSDLSVTGTNLVNQGVRQIGDRNYLLLTNASGLSRGATLELRFASQRAWQDMIKWGFLGLAVLLVIAGVVAPSFFRRLSEPEKQSNPSKQTPADAAQTHGEFDEIIQAIADLDDAYETGGMDEKAYRRERKKLKNRAISLWMTEVEDG